MNPKYLISIFVVTFFACGGGGGSGSYSTASSSSSSSSSLSILYDPPTFCAITETGGVTDFATSSDNCGQTLTSFYTELMNLGINTTTNFEPNSFIGFSQLYLDPAIDGRVGGFPDLSAAIVQTLSKAAELMGVFDIYYFGLYTSVSGYESVIKPSWCAAFGDSICDDSTGTLKHVRELVNSSDALATTVGFFPDQSGAPKKAYAIAQGLIDLFARYRILYHEYVHIWQHAVTFGMSTPENVRRMPAWYSEGVAQYIAEIYCIEQETFGCNSDDWDSVMNNKWTQASDYYNADAANRLTASLASLQNSAMAEWAIAYMIEKAEANGKSNGEQSAIIDLTLEVVEKGWAKAFEDNIGMTQEQFYTDFHNAIAENDQAARVAALKDKNFSTRVSFSFNFSVLQLTGASTSSSSYGGGTPSADKRTIYFYDNDTSTIPSYQGSAWPYVVSTEEISKAVGVTATVAKNGNGNYVLINNKPVYQYASDNDSSKLGAKVNNWKAIGIDGTAIPRERVGP